MQRSLLLLATLCVGATSLPAQTSAVPNPAIEQRLARALKLFPDADTDKDGLLSINEGLKYLEAHPDVKARFFAKVGGASSNSKPATFSPGAEGTKVFVCAHSYMIYTAGMLPAIAKSGGISHLNAGQQMIGGSSVIQHWNLPDEKNEAKKALREGIVDVLMVSPNLELPDQGIENYMKLGLDKNPKLRVLVQASWVPWDGKPNSFTNVMRDATTVEEIQQMRTLHHEGWLKKLEAQATALNAVAGDQTVCIVPVSAAVYALRELVAQGKAPGLAKQSEMFRDDHGHPANVMALLVSYCHFAAIYQRTPVGLPLPASMKGQPQAEELNHLLQQVAWDAVSTYPMSGVKVAALK
jgi:hypothetical protein